MRRDDESRIWMVTGALGSIALGIALIPLRSLTSASNLAFVFLIFTIVAAELGGRSAGLVTALVSAISLNFFLTEPYLRLTISKPDDIVAFFALAVCGLIAAAFGRRRERWSELAGREGKELDVVKRLVEQLQDGQPLDGILGDLKRSFRARRHRPSRRGRSHSRSGPAGGDAGGRRDATDSGHARPSARDEDSLRHERCPFTRGRRPPQPAGGSQLHLARSVGR